jgi:hypothetical protein
MRSPLAPGFLFSVDNFGATYTTAAFGTAVAQGAGAHGKGTDVELISDTLVTEDCFGIAICIMATNAAAAIRNYLVDIKTDPAGGTTYATVINNLIANGSAVTAGGQWYYFPLFIKAGTAIAAATQANVGNGTANSIPRLGVRLFGKPIHPELLKYGSFVRTFGADTANSRGTAITPGTSAIGAYTASLGTTADDLWWWQGGYNVSDTNKILCAHHIHWRNTSGELCGGGGMGIVPPYMPMKSGSNVYMRAAFSTTPDGTVTCVAYGLGG